MTNEPTDVHQLSPMAEAAHEALGAPPGLAVLADRGYHNGPEVARCLAAGMVPTVPAPQTSKNEAAGRFTKAQFTYLPESDAYRCPAGQVLPFRFETEEHGAAQRYYYDNAACAGCPLRPAAPANGSGAGRRLKRWARRRSSRRWRRDWLPIPARGCGARVWSSIRRDHQAGGRRELFLVRGLAKVRAEFSLMALAYNLRRAVAVVGVPRLVAALRPAGAASAGPERFATRGQPLGGVGSSRSLPGGNGVAGTPPLPS